MGWEVVFAPRSESDLAKIVSHIANDAPAAAIRFGETLINKAESLADVPGMGAAAGKGDHPISTRRQLSDYLST